MWCTKCFSRSRSSRSGSSSVRQRNILQQCLFLFMFISNILSIGTTFTSFIFYSTPSSYATHLSLPLPLHASAFGLQVELRLSEVQLIEKNLKRTRVEGHILASRCDEDVIGARALQAG